MKRFNYFMLMLAFLFLVGCAVSADDEEGQDKLNEDEALEASAQKQHESLTVSIVNQDDEQIGEAILSEDQNGVKIELEVAGITPGIHGFHIHETGMCTAPTFELAGGHFNPEKQEHGFLNPNGPHAGDLPNVVANSDGNISDTIVTKRVTLKKDASHSLVNNDGTALMIHADSDDYITNPAGNAGERIACGVISLSN